MTTPRDDIAGLSERNNADWRTALNILLLLEHGCDEKFANRTIKQWNEKCAQLDSLLKERDSLQARVKELEKDLCRSVERDSGGLAPDGTPWKQFAFQQAEKRGRAEQERDEAYERAATAALAQRCVRGTAWDIACTTIADAIRRLASGPEKEKKE